MREHMEAVKKHPPKLKWKPIKKDKRGDLTPTKKQLNTMPYGLYLQTAQWKAKRKQKLRSTRGRCERCGDYARQVHHKKYGRRGREKLTDLLSVCDACHKREHECGIENESHLRAIIWGAGDICAIARAAFGAG